MGIFSQPPLVPVVQGKSLYPHLVRTSMYDLPSETNNTTLQLIIKAFILIYIP